MPDKNTADIFSLRRTFQNDRNGYGPYIYLPLDRSAKIDTREQLSKLISSYKKSGVHGVIPYSHKNFSITALTDDCGRAWRSAATEVIAAKMQLGYQDDTYIMREYLANTENSDQKVCTVLQKYDYACMEKQHFRKKLHNNGDVMSLCAVNDDNFEVEDLRPYIKDGCLEYDVPDGNWTVEEYVIEPDPESNYINLMDYDVCSAYLSETFGRLDDSLSGRDEDGSSIFSLFLYRDVIYAGKNRRMWHRDFNKRFEELNGFDPAVLYPVLFRTFPGNSGHYRSMLLIVRSSMLNDGYLKACADICKSRRIFCTGYAAESKSTACSWLFGDGQLIHRYASAPGVSMPFAYLYGINAVKVAAGCADALGCDTVTADMFRYFRVLSKDVIYRETMNAFVRGVNMVFAHLGEDRSINPAAGEGFGCIYSKANDLAEYSLFTSRCQSMLRGGEHIADAAIIYPIHSLYTDAYLYQSEVRGFEYPATPESADYMELMNNFLNYAGIDASFIHPNLIIERGYSEKGKFFVNSEGAVGRYKILVLPSLSLVSLKATKIVKKYFDEGGKIIAVGSLPKEATECSITSGFFGRKLNAESPEDIEVREIVEHIFGKDVFNSRIIKRYYKNENENGGIAYFFPPNKSSIDGTSSVSADLLYQAVLKFGIAPDIYIDRLPRREFLGIVNQNLPQFLRIDIDKRLAKGCSMNAIHKRYSGCDIYYFTNTTGEKYYGSILLRGRHVPEEWNPQNGRIRKLTYETVKFRGDVYTKILETLEPSSSLFIVSPVQKPKEYDDEETLEEFFAHENY